MLDKAEIECRFRRSVDSYEENAKVQKLITEKLACLLRNYLPPDPLDILEVGCGTGLMTEKILRLAGKHRLYINDLVREMCHKTAHKHHLRADQCLIGDIETIPLDSIFQLIVSASTFQWFTAPDRTFSKLAASLSQGGWMIFSTFGTDNLYELNTLTGKGLAYHPSEKIKSFLETDFEILYLEENRHTLYFTDPVEILRHIKNTGVNATEKPQIWTKKKLMTFSQEYAARFLTHGKYPLTYHPVYFVCRKKRL